MRMIRPRNVALLQGLEDAHRRVIQTLIPIGRHVKPWGTVAGYRGTEGETFYVFKNEHGDVSVIDAATVHATPRTPEGK